MQPMAKAGNYTIPPEWIPATELFQRILPTVNDDANLAAAEVAKLIDRGRIKRALLIWEHGRQEQRPAHRLLPEPDAFAGFEAERPLRALRELCAGLWRPTEIREARVFFLRAEVDAALAPVNERLKRLDSLPQHFRLLGRDEDLKAAREALPLSAAPAAESDGMCVTVSRAAGPPQPVRERVKQDRFEKWLCERIKQGHEAADRARTPTELCRELQKVDEDIDPPRDRHTMRKAKKAVFGKE
jgi:hypothetical protein